MASKLTGEEFEEIRNTFSQIDSNNNGQITRSEFREFLSAKRSDEEIDYIMRLMDMDSSDSVEFPEYLKIIAVLDYKKPPHEYHITQMFRALDKDGNGVLSPDEVTSLWSIFTDVVDMPGLEEIEDLMQTLDTNKDGKIEYGEFITKLDFTKLN